MRSLSGVDDTSDPKLGVIRPASVAFVDNENYRSNHLHFCFQ